MSSGLRYLIDNYSFCNYAATSIKSRKRGMTNCLEFCKRESSVELISSKRSVNR